MIGLNVTVNPTPLDINLLGGDVLLVRAMIGSVKARGRVLALKGRYN